jgi:3'-5' exoribonuclease
LKDDVCHLILSHHGSLEYGAAKLPSTPEAVVLACCDVMSARVYQLNDPNQKLRDNSLVLPGAMKT